MIVLDLLDVLDLLADDQRDLVLNALLKELTIYSHYVILEAQLEWNGEGSYRDFVKYLNDVIRECIKIEISFYGKILRKQNGLAPLTLRTELFL